MSQYLSCFTEEEYKKAKYFLAYQIATMMGRKLEEGDWTSVYCKAKGIPESGWSNLKIDVNFQGLGVEHKLLAVPIKGSTIKTICGTTLMHPAATRSIRISNLEASPNEVMIEVLEQYNELIKTKGKEVKKNYPDCTKPDIRIGWLLWERTLTEFLYFEEKLSLVKPDDFYAEWNITPARGIRKSSKSLWVYDKITNKKKYSVTTSAGIKIQPYFDVPAPTNQNLYFFRVQSEPIDADTFCLWVSSKTALSLKNIVGTIEKDPLSKAIDNISLSVKEPSLVYKSPEDLAIPIYLTKHAFEKLISTFEGVSDEHRVQQLIEYLSL